MRPRCSGWRLPRCALCVVALLCNPTALAFNDGLRVDDVNHDIAAQVAALDKAVEALVAPPSLRGGERGRTQAGSSSSAATHHNADCVAAGMSHPLSPCDPVIAKIISHLQFPPLDNDDAASTAASICEIATILPSGSLWGGGFGGDSRFVLPGLIAGMIRSGRGINVISTTCRRTWTFNDPQSATTLCPGKSWYECYFSPSTSCAVPAKCTPKHPTATRNLYNDLTSFVEDATTGAAFSDDLLSAFAFTKSRLDKVFEYVQTHRSECISTPRHDAATHGYGGGAKTTPPTARMYEELRARLELRTDHGQALPNIAGAIWSTLRLHATALFFEPNAMLRRFLEDMKTTIGWVPHKMVGIQVRHTDMVVERPEIGLASYCSVAARMMAQTGFTHVFLATDDRGITQKRMADCIVATARLEDTRLPGEPTVLLQHWARSAGSTASQASHAGASAFGIAALIDIILLSECDAVAITDGSSFSELALMRAIVNGVQIWDVVQCSVEPNQSMRDDFERIPGVVNHFPKTNAIKWKARCQRDVKHVVIADNLCSVTQSEIILNSKLEKRFDSHRDQKTSCVDFKFHGFAGLEQADLCDALCKDSHCSFLVPIAHAGELVGAKTGWVEPGSSTNAECVMIHFAGREACETFTTARCLTDPHNHMCRGAKPLSGKQTYCSVYVATQRDSVAPPIDVPPHLDHHHSVALSRENRYAGLKGPGQCAVAYPNTFADGKGDVENKPLPNGVLPVSPAGNWRVCRSLCAQYWDHSTNKRLWCAGFTLRGTECSLFGPQPQRLQQRSMLGTLIDVKPWEIDARSDVSPTSVYSAVMPPGIG